MEEFLQRLFQSDLMPHGACWQWEPCAQAREVEQRVINLRQDIQEETHWVREDGAVFDLLIDKFPLVDTTDHCWGLGLAAIHGIVRGHQGCIHVSSEPGRGSTFKLLFPAAQGQAGPAVADPPLPRSPASRTSGEGKVLVVDDEDEMRAVVVAALGRAGLQVLQARDGKEALGLFQEHGDQIRLIIMDLTMPNMDGEEACRELRRNGAAVPVILSSGFNETEALLRFEGLGLAGFLQ